MSEQNQHSSFLKNVRVDLIICLVGFGAMVGQVLLLRRFIAVFGGNELVIGAVFWMPHLRATTCTKKLPDEDGQRRHDRQRQALFRRERIWARVAKPRQPAQRDSRP